MPKLLRLSGREVVAILQRFGFQAAYQQGSHVRLVRRGPHGEQQGLTVPQHRELGPGLLRAIVRQASQFIPADELRPWFYSD
jgi:predicted RNA binding protein YcfA (HicA-like mRNA interferase family)